MSTRREDRDPEAAEMAALMDGLRARFEGHVHSVEVVRDTGCVIARDGRKLFFMPSAVRVSGSVTQMSALRPGQPVTFDLSETSAGPRIARLWTGDGPWRGESAE